MRDVIHAHVLDGLCTTCAGTGRFGEFHWVLDERGAYKRAPIRPCPTCDGTGQLPDHLRNRRQSGRSKLSRD
jgi:hypothetical protein